MDRMFQQAVVLYTTSRILPLRMVFLACFTILDDNRVLFDPDSISVVICGY